MADKNNKNTTDDSTPSTPPPPAFSVEKFFGQKLLTNPKVSKPTAELLKDKELIALYFSASWCPPCRQFSPMLRKFYEAHAKDYKLEIIYVSSDKTVGAFEDYYRTMPWLAVPTEKGSSVIKQRLADTFLIMGIPALMVIDAKTGLLISANGRDEVAKVNDNLEKGKELMEVWKAAERRPVSEAQSMSAGGNIFMKILMYFARNPMFLVGLLYFYKYFKAKMVEGGGGGGQEL